MSTAPADDEATYRLDGRRIEGSLDAAFRWEPSGLHAAHDRKLLADLLENGTRRTAGFALHSPAAEHPVYAERDEAVYRIDAREGDRVERPRWICWFELLEDASPSADDIVLEYDQFPENVPGIDSPRAANALSTAFPLRSDGPQDVSDEPPADRGHVFHRYGADDTPLLPEAPFEYVHLEWQDESVLFRVRTQEAAVETQEIIHEATLAYESEGEFRAAIENESLETTFDPERLPDEQREIVETITRRREPARYEETPPPSDAFEAILDRLGISADWPDDGPRFSDWAYFEYGGTLYSARLERM
ncbi:hypothetical protein D8Y22_07855 [Salinadaptatus halalkaliphilus]|uniref:Uncharacterized protein n=1 Tax=Salinadaptatus halalkaliphilus TaxID=2419781 RepID=A0A4S3TRC1_9EURY|nr:hypothetical protein D8Y22_07855 [Salinadaptatus halalkaliphilus]